MTVLGTKLSQIAPSPSNFQTGDQLVGVRGGTTDLLFASSQVVAPANPPFPLPPGGFFPNWYVDPTTGSDSNDGLSPATAFMTVQRGANEAVKYDYGGIGAPTINLADGTYTAANQNISVFGSIVLPLLHNSPNSQGGYFISGNLSGFPQNVVFDFGFNFFVFNVADFTAAVFTGIHFKVYNFVPLINNFSSALAIQGCEFEPTTSGAGRDLVADNSQSFGTISVDDTVTITAGATAGKYGALFGSFTHSIVQVFSSITFTASFDVTAGAVFVTEQFSQTVCPSARIVNPGDIVGRGAVVTGQSIFDGETASPTNYPGSVPSYVDQTSSWAFKTLAGAADYQAMVLGLSALPTTADLAQTGWGFFRDTSTGGRVGLYTNDAGTVYNIAPQVARVSTQFDKTNDAALADVTGLTINVAASSTYEFTATLFTVSNVAGGVQAAVGGTCTATAIIYEGETTQSAAIAAQTRSTALGGAVGAVTAVIAARIDLEGMITVNTAGTLTIQFAQNIANGTASSVLVGSYFKVQQVE
jgi:hypothetical protein